MGCAYCNRKITINGTKSSNPTTIEIELNNTPKNKVIDILYNNKQNIENKKFPNSSKFNLGNLNLKDEIVINQRHIQSMNKLKLIAINELIGNKKFFN